MLGVIYVVEDDFEEFMEEQIERIRNFRHRINEDENRDLSLDEAARKWIRDYAQKFRKYYHQSDSQ